jgi:hypothetical protein
MYKMQFNINIQLGLKAKDLKLIFFHKFQIVKFILLFNI